MNFGLMLIGASVALSILSTVFVVMKAKKEEYPLRRRGLFIISSLVSILFIAGIYFLIVS